ncbi:Protein GlcT [Bienertia sinuspersici]
MKCQSYLPVHHSCYDLNVDANVGASPLYNGNGTFRSGHYSDFVSSPIPRGNFPYKELLRQTMLMHEVTFKDQVQELHRLYRRQKELMGEIKSKEVYMNQSQIGVQSLNSTSARMLVGCGQNNMPCSLPFISSHCTPSYTSRDSIQMSLGPEKEPKPPSSPVASRYGDTLNDLHILECKGKKIKGKLLDLELPAETYIDSDEEESLEDATFSKVLTPATLYSNKQTKVVVETDVADSTENRSLLSTRSFSGNKTSLADLNEPLDTSYMEESGGDKKTNSSLEISESNLDQLNGSNITSDDGADKLTTKTLAPSEMAKSEVGSASSVKKPSYKWGQKQNPLVVQALPSFNSQLSSSKGRQKGLLNKVNGSSRFSPKAKSSKSSCSESKSKVSVQSSKTPDLNCIDMNSAVVAISEVTEVETVKKSKRCRVIDINLPCDPMIDDEPFVQDDLAEHDCKNSARLNMNSCTKDNDLQSKSSSLDKSRLDIDLRDPSVQKWRSAHHLEEILKRINQKKAFYHETADLKICEASDNGNLEWFAGLVDSFSIDLEKDIDDFEAMTLELPEMKVEEYSCKNNVQISSEPEPCSVLLSCQTRKGRTRRSKRKDFQKEVLPSLASLSRYEVTEDIQMIEGLMEAAGTPWQVSRTRRTCRMGRKPRVAKQQSFVDDAHVPELRAHVSWGVVNRRPRGRRSPVSPTVLSKWFDCMI